MIKFCSICDNMMYMMLNKEQNNKLQFTCKNCNNVEDEANDIDDKIVDSSYVEDVSVFGQYVNPNITHDPTLPHVSNIKCQNAACSKKAEQQNDVIYAIIDKKNKKLLFHCCYCKHTWHLK